MSNDEDTQSGQHSHPIASSPSDGKMAEDLSTIMQEAREFARIAAERGITNEELVTEIVALRQAVTELRNDLRTTTPTKEELVSAEHRMSSKRRRLGIIVTIGILLWGTIVVWIQDDHIKNCHILPAEEEPARLCDLLFPLHDHPHFTIEDRRELMENGR